MNFGSGLALSVARELQHKMQCDDTAGSPVFWVWGVATVLCGWLRRGGGRRSLFDLGHSPHNFDICNMRVGCAWKMSC